MDVDAKHCTSLKLFLNRLAGINIRVWISILQGFYKKTSDFPHINKILLLEHDSVNIYEALTYAGHSSRGRGFRDKKKKLQSPSPQEKLTRRVSK